MLAKQIDGTVLDEYSIIKSDLSKIERTNVDADSDRVTVKGVAGASAAITIFATYPDVETITSADEIVYLDKLKTNGNGVYYFNFGGRKKDIGEHKIMMNVDGTTNVYGYMYQPELYAVEDNTAIEKLSDIQGTEIDAKLEIINTDDGKLFCAQYNNGILKDVSYVNINKGKSGGMTFSYLGKSNVDEIRLFFWDRTYLKPMINPVIIK